MKKSVFIEKINDFSTTLPLDSINQIIPFNTVSSTNKKAKALARQGKENGTVVISPVQTQGRGRFNREWESPEGGLYLSLILRPDISLEKTSLFPLIGSLAVAKTVNSWGVSSAIKWPNDVHIKRKKIAGVLAESETMGRHLLFIVLGIGVNINIKMDQFPQTLRPSATSLLEELGEVIDYYDFLKTLLSTFNEIYSRYLAKEFDELLDQWRALSDTIGKKVRIVTSSETITGLATDIDKHGFLLIKTHSGDVKKITCGDCLYFDEL